MGDKGPTPGEQENGRTRTRENFNAQDQDVKLKFEFLQPFAFVFPLKKELPLVE